MEASVTETKDPYEDMLKCIKEKRQMIIDEFNGLEWDGFSFPPSRARDNFFGDCRHHIGIDIRLQNRTVYFIGFAGLNIDEKTGNIHSSIGRIQLFIGNGQPNIKHKVDDKVWYEIKYPRKKDKALKGIKECKDCLDIKNGCCVFNSGYRIFGNEKSGDDLINTDNVNKFCNLVKDFIEYYEGLKKQ